MLIVFVLTSLCHAMKHLTETKSNETLLHSTKQTIHKQTEKRHKINQPHDLHYPPTNKTEHRSASIICFQNQSLLSFPRMRMIFYIVLLRSWPVVDLSFYNY